MVQTSSSEWQTIHPSVNAEAEFFEIVNDFGNPLEILREAISNSIDAGATWVRIDFDVREVDGNRRLIITISDDGRGMTNQILERDFWGLGFSPSRDNPDAIGEKGHGTKIFLRSERVTVQTQSNEGAYLSECVRPLASLAKKQIHQPRIRQVEAFWDHTGTQIEVIGYNDNERAKFRQSLVKDYLIWFTKIGSIELEFGIEKLRDFKVYLKAVDVQDFEEIKFGHVFPDENADIQKLFNEEGAAGADKFVKYYKVEAQRLERFPEVTFDAFISVESDEAKRQYNSMIRQRRRSDTGSYRVADRYGLWLCRDYMPVVRVNEWLPRIGTGSNSFVLLHGFVNCQALSLTANRGTISNTDPQILEELQRQIQQIVSGIDFDLRNNNLYTLREWGEEETTLEQEKNEFNRRIKNLAKRKIGKLGDRTILEPVNESELFGVFVTVYTLCPELFDFEPIDYNTNRGIDIIARNKTSNQITERENWYVELKHTMQLKPFNHAYVHLRYIVCWDFDPNVIEGSEFIGVEEGDRRYLQAETDENGYMVYFLDNKRRANKIEVIRLKQFLEERLNLTFVAQK